MVELGQDVSEQLDIVPMQLRVMRHTHKRYGCPGSQQAPIKASPAQPWPKSNASVDFLATLLAVKFVDGLPLARQSCRVPVWAELHAWMLTHAPLVKPRSALGTVLAYMSNLWPQLTRYTWLRQVLGDLPATKTVEAVEARLPWNLRLPDLLGKSAL